MISRNTTNLVSIIDSDDEDSIVLVQSVTIAKAALYSFLFTLGVFGNVLVIKATTKFVTLRKPTNILICNLCMCDITVMFIGIPMFVAGEKLLVQHFGMIVCKVIDPLLVAVLTATVFTLIAIAVERCNVIVNTVQSKINLTPRKALVIVCSIDVTSILMASPLLFSKFRKGCCERDWTETTHMIYVCTLFFLQYLIPLFLMTLLYTVCWYRIRKKNQKTIAFSVNNRSSTRNRSQSDNNLERPVSKLLNDAADVTTSFLSNSKNHLSGIKRNTSIRRSFSADSVYSMASSKDSPKNTCCRRSVTLDHIKKEAENCNRPVSLCDSQNQQQQFKLNNLLQTSLFLRGSVQKFQHSFTSLIIGADNTTTDTLTVFALERIKQTIKTLKVFAFILAIFAVCMLPHHVAELLHVSKYQAGDSSPFFAFMHGFLYINAAINPWIYAGMNKGYRLAYRTIFWKKNHLASMLRNNLFRTPSGNVLFEKNKSKFHVTCLNHIVRPLCGRLLKDHHNDDCEVVADSRERRDTLKSLSNDFRSRKYSAEARKESRVSRGSRKTSSAVSEYEIPVLAPIIIVTCYDDEIAAVQDSDDDFVPFHF